MMLHFWKPEDDAKLDAIYSSQIVAEFAIDGTILAANSNFLAVFGYEFDEIVGHKHSMLVDESYRLSKEYADLWADLRKGQARAIECQRITKAGQGLWLQATYTPIKDRRGRVQKIVKFATDITTDALRNLDYEGQIEALNRSQAIAEFSLDGKILYANENFLKAFGYSSYEIVGRHHRILVADATAASEEYALFWRNLAAGRYQSAEYQRVGKNGQEVFIQASYNPIKDRNGATIKILKMATDVTSQVREQKQRAHLQSIMKRGLDAISVAFDNVSHQAHGATKSVSQAASDVDAVIDGAESLFVTIGGISTKVGRASQASSQAMQEIERTTNTVNGLSDHVAKIGEVSTLINGIALQTNLLALNATIEAARAGEAGKGFSVVAQEVKNLANQTRHATETIKGQIVSVRAATHSAVDAIAMVKETIRSIHELSGAASVDIVEQEASVRTMAQSMKAVSASGQLISNGMGTIVAATKSAGEITEQIRQASQNYR